MALSRIVLRLAPNPGGDAAGGDDERGYTLVAALNEDGRLDEAAESQSAEGGSVRRFVTGEDALEGRLVKGEGGWVFDFDDGSEVNDQPIYRLGEHRLVVGEYVTVQDETGQPMTYKVTEVGPA